MYAGLVGESVYVNIVTKELIVKIAEELVFVNMGHINDFVINALEKVSVNMIKEKMTAKNVQLLKVKMSKVWIATITRFVDDYKHRGYDWASSHSHVFSTKEKAEKYVIDDIMWSYWDWIHGQGVTSDPEEDDGEYTQKQKWAMKEAKEEETTASITHLEPIPENNLSLREFIDANWKCEFINRQYDWSVVEEEIDSACKQN